MPQQARHEEDQAIYPDVCPTACWSSVREHETSLPYGKNMQYAASAAKQSAVLLAHNFQRSVWQRVTFCTQSRFTMPGLRTT